MKQLTDKVAFVTGAASGVGLGIARALLSAGAKVVITDIRKEALGSALVSLNAGNRAHAIQLDVSDRTAWSHAADEAEWHFGAVHILCANAGVNLMGRVSEATFDDWDYTLRINIGGGINAVTTFVPRMQTHGEDAHIVITSSVHGLYTGAVAGVYSVSKFGLVALGESLRADLADSKIGVSVLCPGPVKSELFESTDALRPAELSHTTKMDPAPPGKTRAETAIFQYAMGGDEVGERVILGIRRNDMYIMTHSDTRSILEARHAALINSLPDEPYDAVRHKAIAPVLLDEAPYREQAAHDALRFPIGS